MAAKQVQKASKSAPRSAGKRARMHPGYYDACERRAEQARQRRRRRHLARVREFARRRDAHGGMNLAEWRRAEKRKGLERKMAPLPTVNEAPKTPVEGDKLDWPL